MKLLNHQSVATREIEHKPQREARTLWGSPFPLGDRGGALSQSGGQEKSDHPLAPCSSPVSAAPPPSGSGKSAWGSSRTSLFTWPRWLSLVLPPLGGERRRVGGTGKNGGCEPGDWKAAIAAAVVRS